MGEWSTYRVAETGQIVTGKTPPTSSPEFYGNEVPFVTPTDMDGRRTIDRTIRNLSVLGAEKVNSSYIRQPAIAVSCIGSDMGKAALVNVPFVSNQQINSIIVNEKFDRLFVYYNLSARKAEIRDKASGAAQPILNKTDFGNLLLSAPCYAEQVAISHTLAALDDKIELHRRMNDTLDTMARAIFRDWFVDFGPTRAKMEGREPYLAPDLWQLFPGRFDDNGIPEAWELSEIGREVEAVGGATPSTKEASFWEDGEHHWATPKDLSKLVSPVLLNTDRKITDAGVKKISSGLLPVGTVLLSSRAPIGYLAIAEVPTAVNQGFIAMVCEKRLPNVFVLFWCYENLDLIKGISGGSTFAEISKKAFRPIPVIVPSEQVLAAHQAHVRPLYDRIVANTNEAVSLGRTRDLLLPKLMSGEITLTDAEQAAGGVA